MFFGTQFIINLTNGNLGQAFKAYTSIKAIYIVFLFHIEKGIGISLYSTRYCHFTQRIEFQVVKSNYFTTFNIWTF